MQYYETPKSIQQLLALTFEYIDDHGDEDVFDFDPHGYFYTPEENAELCAAHTGNNNYSGDEFRIFARTGDGSEYAFWIVDTGRPLFEQPIVLIESEGQWCTMATNYSDFLWMMFGARRLHPSLQAYLEQYTTTPKRDYDTIYQEANAQYNFKCYFSSQCV